MNGTIKVEVRTPEFAFSYEFEGDVTHEKIMQAIEKAKYRASLRGGNREHDDHC